MTKVDNIDATGAKAKPFSAIPTVYEFYHEAVGQEATQPEWQGGEMIFLTTTQKLYIQTNTSGTTGSWATTDNSWATTTSTSTSTSTSSSTSTSTSTSSTTTS